jgi:hypothetical protein
MEREREDEHFNFEKFILSFEQFSGLNINQICAIIFLKPNLLNTIKKEFSEKEYELNHLISNNKYLLQN